MLVHELSPRFERLEFALELGEADDARDELDVLRLKQVFVLALRVFGDQAYGCRAWVDGGVREWSAGKCKVRSAIDRMALERGLTSDVASSSCCSESSLWLLRARHSDPPRPANLSPARRSVFSPCT